MDNVLSFETSVNPEVVLTQGSGIIDHFYKVDAPSTLPLFSIKNVVSIALNNEIIWDRGQYFDISIYISRVETYDMSRSIPRVDTYKGLAERHCLKLTVVENSTINLDLQSNDVIFHDNSMIFLNKLVDSVAAHTSEVRITPIDSDLKEESNVFINTLMYTIRPKNENN